MPTLKAAAFFTLSRVPVLKPVPSLPLALPAEGMVVCSQENWEAQGSQQAPLLPHWGSWPAGLQRAETQCFLR